MKEELEAKSGDHHFTRERFVKLRLPEDPETWKAINADLVKEFEEAAIVQHLQDLMERGADATEAAKACADHTMDKITELIHDTFKKYGLLGKRNFSAPSPEMKGGRGVAPTSLRWLRQQASRATNPTAALCKPMLTKRFVQQRSDRGTVSRNSVELWRNSLERRSALNAGNYGAAYASQIREEYFPPSGDTRCCLEMHQNVVQTTNGNTGPHKVI